MSFELIPLDTVVRIKNGIHAGKKARIKDYNYVKDDKGFLNYFGFVQGLGRNLYALYHDDLEIINPSTNK